MGRTGLGVLVDEDRHQAIGDVTSASGRRVSVRNQKTVEGPTLGEQCDRFGDGDFDRVSELGDQLVVARLTEALRFDHLGENRRAEELLRNGTQPLLIAELARLVDERRRDGWRRYGEGG